MTRYTINVLKKTRLTSLKHLLWEYIVNIPYNLHFLGFFFRVLPFHIHTQIPRIFKNIILFVVETIAAIIFIPIRI